jgi:ABC-type nitrate/sulfonate/bicarbonate transport system substrate-binding protein
MRRTWIAAAALVLALTSCGARATPVSIALDWTPNTNHTGIFVAQDLGYFALEGLEVTVLEPSPVVSLQLVASGRADFGVSSQEYVVMARAEETPVVSVATLYPHNTSGFAALATTGIASPADFAGRRYGGWGSDLETVMIETVMENAGADPAQVEVINMGTLDFATAAQVGLADFFWIYYGWEGIHAQLLGLEFNYLPLADLDPVLDYYTPVLVASEATIEERPDVARRFLRALARGYVYCATSPEAAAEILIAHAPELDRELVLASQRWLAAQTERSLGAWGRQDAEVWRRFAAWALAHALIRHAVEPDGAFTNALLPEDSSP